MARCRSPGKEWANNFWWHLLQSLGLKKKRRVLQLQLDIRRLRFARSQWVRRDSCWLWKQDGWIESNHHLTYFTRKRRYQIKRRLWAPDLVKSWNGGRGWRYNTERPTHNKRPSDRVIEPCSLNVLDSPHETVEFSILSLLLEHKQYLVNASQVLLVRHWSS